MGRFCFCPCIWCVCILKWMCTGSGELREGICMYTERLRKQVRKRLRIIICCVERCSRCAIGCMLVIVRGIELGYMHTELLAEIEDKPRLESRLEIKLRGRQLHLVLSAYIRSEYLNDSDRLVSFPSVYGISRRFVRRLLKIVRVSRSTSFKKVRAFPRRIP